MWVNLGQNEWKAAVGGKRQPAVKFSVKEIEYADGKVCKLVIVDESGKERFVYENGKRMSKAAPKEANAQPVQNNANLSYEDMLGAAVLDVEACKSVDELTALWYAYKAQFEKEQRFLDALTSRKKELQKVA